MSRRADWSYVQARLQARHGERPREVDWHMLEGAKTLDHFLERSRATSLRRFTDRLSGGMTSHAIERTLRAEWRAYAAEVAAWTAPAWRPAVRWAAYLPDLVVLDRLFAGDRAEWMREDPVFGPLTGVDRQTDMPRLEHSAFRPLAPTHGEGMAERWLAHWRSSWPHRADELAQLADLVSDHAGRLARAGAEETSGPYRRDLAQVLARMFRRHAGTAVAPFCHLALVALDLERLRGGLVRRSLFGEHAREVA